MNEIAKAIKKLTVLVNAVPQLLEKRKEEDFAVQPWLGIWSKKQMLGHLIDTAAITHQRIVRMQYENEPILFFDRKRWMDLQYYNAADSSDLIQLWKWYNKHLLHIIKNITVQNLQRSTSLKSGEQYNLKLLIEDYVDDTETSLIQILGVKW